MPQLQLPIFPAGVTRINPQVAVLCEADRVVYLHGHLPVFQHGREDVSSFRLFTSQMIATGTVRQAEIARRARSVYSMPGRVRQAGQGMSLYYASIIRDLLLLPSGLSRI